jgi:hypothetical protein
MGRPCECLDAERRREDKCRHGAGSGRNQLAEEQAHQKDECGAFDRARQACAGHASSERGKRALDQTVGQDRLFPAGFAVETQIPPATVIDALGGGGGVVALIRIEQGQARRGTEGRDED